MIYCKLLALLLLTGLAGCGQSKFEQLDRLLQKTFPAGKPGAAVGMVQNGKLVFEKYYGLANLEDSTPVSAVTHFNIGSVTKQFTAAAILQLVEKQEISLNDTLKKFFPELHPAIANTVTVRHLLTHTSGIKDHYPFIDAKPGMHVYDSDVLQAVEKMDSLYFPPGTHYRYSNTGYCLLALIVEQARSRAYGQYLKENIFGPLGMNNASVISAADTIAHRAIGYDYDTVKKQFNRSDAQESPFFSTEGDGGIYTSLTDYVKWLNGFFEGKVLQPSSVQQATQIQFMIDSAKKLGYGFGWFVGALEKPEVVYHTGSNGGFRAMVVTIPSENYALVIFSNRSDLDLEKLVGEINRIFKSENKSLQRIDSLISFNHSWPIFAPCKRIPRYLISSIKNCNVNVTA